MGDSVHVRNSHEDSVYRRETAHRIFVNRSLQLQKIRFYGFDMDYTLAEYKSPAYETLSFKVLIQRLVDIGYPDDLLKFNYDHSVPIRGLWFDKDRGNLLKVDQFGNILNCMFGLHFLPTQEVRKVYPNKFVVLCDRFFLHDTLFNLPEMYALASMIEYFNNLPDVVRQKDGFLYKDVLVSFRSLFYDVRSSMDFIHDDTVLKTETVKNMDMYIAKNPLLPNLIENLTNNGAKTFLLTNSNYWYTKHVMAYLLGDNWMNFFDYVVVDAQKPRFFSEGTLMRSVDTKTGNLELGTCQGPLKRGVVYSGGSCSVFSQLIDCRGKDVLYVGDHIFGDVIKSKKLVGWRTLLIIPELANELYVWKKESKLFSYLEELDVSLSRLYKNADITCSHVDPAKLQEIREKIRSTVHGMDSAYGFIGSLFRCGSRLTSFASQVERYADLYCQSVTNLCFYPRTYMFRAPAMLMPHESTVPRCNGNSPPEKVTESSAFSARAAGIPYRKNSAPEINNIHTLAKSHCSISSNGTERSHSRATNHVELDDSDSNGEDDENCLVGAKEGDDHCSAGKLMRLVSHD